MDIKSMVNSEDSPPPRKSSISNSAIPEYRHNLTRAPSDYDVQLSVDDNHHEIRPPQPSPLQTQGHHDTHAPTGELYLQSTYQHNTPSSFSSGHHAAGPAMSQSPSHGQQVSQYLQREGQSTTGYYNRQSLSHSTPRSQNSTMTTPGSIGAHSSFQRPSSSHSIPTPNSAYHSSSFPRESPQPLQTPLRSTSQSQNGFQYISQPSTPLGPPPNHPRPSLNVYRESPGAYDHQRTLSGSSYGQPQVTTPSSAAVLSPQDHKEQNARPRIREQSSFHNRDGSLSVSPKTRLPSKPRPGSMEAPSDSFHRHYEDSQVVHAQYRAERDASEHNSSNRPHLDRTPSFVRSIGVNGLLNAESTTETSQTELRHPVTRFPAHAASQGHDNVPNSMASAYGKTIYQPHLDTTSSAARRLSSSRDTSTQHSTSSHQMPPHEVVDLDSDSHVDHKQIEVESDAQIQPAKKRLRLDQPTNKILPNTLDPKQNLHMPKPELQQDPGRSPTATSSSAKHTQGARIQMGSRVPVSRPHKTKARKVRQWQEVPTYAQSVRGPKRTAELFMLIGQRAVPSQPNGAHKPSGQVPLVNGADSAIVQVSSSGSGPLGPWEPTIKNIIPYDETVRLVSDWLFREVVVRDDIGVVGIGKAGGPPTAEAVFEIEAKIGQLWDKIKNERLSLPVLNECVISRFGGNHGANADSNFRVGNSVVFQSSMTEAEHRKLNKTLNTAYAESRLTKTDPTAGIKPRIPMDYAHTYEKDTFYELSQEGLLQLPASIRQALQQPGGKSSKSKGGKVRVTTDQKSGAVIATIVKVPVADLEIYCPRFAFDWRISVNVEMKYKGDIGRLVEQERKDGKKSDRNKDRMSYNHLCYQIDLTQVTPAEATSQLDKGHELEVEMSSEEVRRQGLLWQSGREHQYEDLIKGFLNNVRWLVREGSG